MQWTVTSPPVSSQDDTCVEHGLCEVTHAHVRFERHAAGSALHEYESGGVPPSGSAMPGAWSTHICEPESHVAEGPHASGPASTETWHAQPTPALNHVPPLQIHE